jgi:glycosyltransferase involved in cell wall biosynthesis
MRICYVLLSPTFGMHQYTADLANRIAAAGHHARLITTTGCPRDRYAPSVELHTPFTSTGTGFSPEGARLLAFRRVHAALLDLGVGISASVVHVTGVHLWNLPLVWALRRRGIPVVHTLHDLDPHYGRRFSSLIRLWNRLLIASGCHLLVHGCRYRERLLAQGVAPERVTYAPLLHLFLGHQASGAAEPLAGDVRYEPWALFFGRLLPYKGVGDLIAAQAMLDRRGTHVGGVILAGSGDLARVWDGPLPSGVAVRNRLIEDHEALDLFRRCGLLVLPYRDATQSALVAAAYYFRKPVVVTEVGALPEVVQEGTTGWVVPPGDPGALADCLAEALSDPERLAAMGEEGRAFYEQQRRVEWETLLGMYASPGSPATYDR